MILSNIAQPYVAPASSLVRNLFKHYQKGDIQDGEDSFAYGAGEISPVKSDPWTVKPLHEHQLGLLWGLCWMTGAKKRQHQHQRAGYQPKAGQQQGGELHCSGSRCPRSTVVWPRPV